VGVEVEKGGRTRRYRAAQEVILSGGAINSPHLLLLSGVGDADQLRQVQGKFILKKFLFSWTVDTKP
jgi:choline dehydrogenase-like flavoprotein